MRTRLWQWRLPRRVYRPTRCVSRWLARPVRKYSGGSSSSRARSSTRGEIIAAGTSARPSRRRYRYGGDGITRADVSAAVLEGPILEPLAQEGLSLLKERRAGLGVVKPMVDVELDRDPPVAVGVCKFLDVLGDRDPSPVESERPLPMNSGPRGVPARLMMRSSKMRTKTGIFSMSWYCGLNSCSVVRPVKVPEHWV